MVWTNAFNPYNYQTGSVWPHARVQALWIRHGGGAAHDISKAASYFHLNQLPELYTAFQRDETTFQCNICFEDPLDAAIFRSRFEPKAERCRPTCVRTRKIEKSRE
jgi:glycogen debranching enzyme